MKLLLINIDPKLTLGGCSSVVERMLCMYEAPGSIPGISKVFALEKLQDLFFVDHSIKLESRTSMPWSTTWGCSSVVERLIRI